MENTFILEHPLIQHKLSYARQKKTVPKEFRSLVDEITMLILYEVTRHLTLMEVSLETPSGHSRGKIIAGKKLVFIPILRAGLGMLNAAMRLVPRARVGHMGFYRDPDTLQPVEYYMKLPQDIHERDCIILDPTLATGGTAVAAVNILKEKGAKKIKFVGLIAAPQGLETLNTFHPDVEVYLAAVDQGLNGDGLIVPGFGDAGDRLFGTD